MPDKTREEPDKYIEREGRDLSPPDMEMLPCPNPWCKHDMVYARKNQGFSLWDIRCGRCGLEGPACNTKAEAIAAWCTRPQPTDLVEALENPDDALIDAVAKVIMVEMGCGLTVDGERVFCDSERAPEYVRNSCECPVTAKAVLAAVVAAIKEKPNG